MPDLSQDVLTPAAARAVGAFVTRTLPDVPEVHDDVVEQAREAVRWLPDGHVRVDAALAAARAAASRRMTESPTGEAETNAGGCSCIDVADELTAHLGRTPTAPTGGRLALHVGGCPRCAAIVARVAEGDRAARAALGIQPNGAAEVPRINCSVSPSASATPNAAQWSPPGGWTATDSAGGEPVARDTTSWIAAAAPVAVVQAPTAHVSHRPRRNRATLLAGGALALVATTAAALVAAGVFSHDSKPGSATAGARRPPSSATSAPTGVGRAVTAAHRAGRHPRVTHKHRAAARTHRAAVQHSQATGPTVAAAAPFAASPTVAPLHAAPRPVVSTAKPKPASIPAPASTAPAPSTSTPAPTSGPIGAPPVGPGRTP